MPRVTQQAGGDGPAVTTRGHAQVAAPAKTPIVDGQADDAWGANDYVRMLLYGESGSGKTTLWATFPDPILCLICSGGNRPGELKSIDTPENRQRIVPKVVRSLDAFYDELWGAMDGAPAVRKGTQPDYDQIGQYPCRYATIVLDHATGFADLILSQILGRPIPAQKTWGLASQQQYGQLSLQVKDALRKLLNVQANIVVVAQQRTFGGKEDGGDPEVLKPTVGAALTPSLTGWLNPACDYVCQMFKRPKVERQQTMVNGKPGPVIERRAKGVDYCLRVEPHDVFMTKFRAVGGVQTDVIVNPNYDKIVAVSRGESVE